MKIQRQRVYTYRILLYNLMEQIIMEQQLLDLFDTNPTFDNYIKLGNEFVYKALTEQTPQYIHQ